MSYQISGQGSLRGGRKSKLKSEINVVPYIDVMLVLLIIFMVVSPATIPGTVNLPSAEKTALPPTSYIHIALRPDANAEIGVRQEGKAGGRTESVPDHEALMRRLRDFHSSHPDYPVVISGDKDIRYEEVIKTLSDARKMGIKRVGLATR
ncbi:MAG: ExbD/TolR family protein [Burkholderiaceae bacterium]|jgi:biopolymer transport protein TolR|nr:ExbD/TolR family protein [Burkholderiaceae bacterium]